MGPPETKRAGGRCHCPFHCLLLAGSSLLHMGLLQFRQAGVTLGAVHGLLTVAAPLASTGSRRVGFSSCWHTGLVAPWHVESSPTKDRTQSCLEADSSPLDHQSPSVFKPPTPWLQIASAPGKHFSGKALEQIRCS